MFNTNGSVKKIKKNDKNEDYIELFGDHREKIREFLIQEGIGTEENIKVYGT